MNSTIKADCTLLFALAFAGVLVESYPGEIIYSFDVLGNVSS